MSVEKILKDRSQGVCELCGGTQSLSVCDISIDNNLNVETSAIICGTCQEEIANKEIHNTNHWRCLNDSMWSEHNAVKVLTWCLLNRMSSEDWARDLKEMMYLEDDVLAWAERANEKINAATVKHYDSNGNQLFNGDTVTLIQSLDVRGSSLTAKLGTAVRNIRLVDDNAEQIEGKVEGQRIVILTKYVKKQK